MSFQLSLVGPKPTKFCHFPYGIRIPSCMHRDDPHPVWGCSRNRCMNIYFCFPCSSSSSSFSFSTSAALNRTFLCRSLSAAGDRDTLASPVRSCHVVHLNLLQQHSSFILECHCWEFIKVWHVYHYCHFHKRRGTFSPPDLT